MYKNIHNSVSVFSKIHNYKVIHQIKLISLVIRIGILNEMHDLSLYRKYKILRIHYNKNVQELCIREKRKHCWKKPMWIEINGVINNTNALEDSMLLKCQFCPVWFQDLLNPIQNSCRHIFFWQGEVVFLFCCCVLVFFGRNWQVYFKIYMEMKMT